MGLGRARHLRLAARPIVALALLSLVLACGGGGGGSPSEPPPPAPTPAPGPGISFIASSLGPGIVLAQGAATTATSLTLEVRAASVTGLYGLAFDLDYPSAALRFQSASTGPFLGSGGQVSMQVLETTSGHLVVGVTRLGALPGVDGSGVVMQLVFTPVASGSGPIAFSRNQAYKSAGGLLDVPWSAGTVAVVQ